MIELKTKLPKNFRQDCKDKKQYTQCVVHLPAELISSRKMQVLSGRYGMNTYELLHMVVMDFIDSHIASEGGKP